MSAIEIDDIDGHAFEPDERYAPSGSPSEQGLAAREARVGSPPRDASCDLVVAGQLSTGATVPVRSLLDVNGGTVEVPANGGRTHLQFRRFTGCAACHIRLDSFGERYQELVDAGITDVVVLHSADDELRGHKSFRPLAVVADPDWVLYREFAMETGLRAIADPRAWWATIRRENAMLLRRDDSDYASAESRGSAKHFGLPADFLIEPDGIVIAAHYGRHADDQWSVDQLLEVHRSLGHEKAS